MLHFNSVVEFQDPDFLRLWFDQSLCTQHAKSHDFEDLGQIAMLVVKQSPGRYTKP